ncbi:hypothetical protein MKW98_027785 [Papaver atlanticum]|uniref:Pentatricopeptide repeat-containing protein n=1 Tax=Papaver atlanticum TaxID=357466 RepID=A0AAD4SL40_9MAGN|nr:hypothetical protein MKW98_027785 [Papaver atlanticum]
MKTLKISSIRHVRLFSTTNTTTNSSSFISNRVARSELQREFDPDKALSIYSSVSDHSTRTRDLTIKRLAKSRRFSDIESLIESQKESPKITEEPFLSSLIKSYGRAGMFDHALRTFDQMEELGTPRSVLSFNALLMACKADQVPKLFNEISEKYKISPDKVSYGILVRSYCESGCPKSGLTVLKEMEEKNVEITAVTCTILLDAFYKKECIEEADKIWKEMAEKGLLDVTAFNVRIMQTHLGPTEDVLSLLDEMKTLGLIPDAVTYNNLLICYCNHGFVEEAKKVYESFAENKCVPNVVTFTNFIYHLCKNGEVDKGFEVFKDSLKRDKLPNFTSMKYLVQGLFEKSKLEEAKQVIDIAKKKCRPNFLNAWKKIERDLFKCVEEN